MAGSVAMLALSAGSFRDQRPQPGVFSQFLEMKALLLGNFKIGSQPLQAVGNI